MSERYTPEQMREWTTSDAMKAVNALTPDITGKAFDPDWFLLRQRFEEAENMLRQAAADAEALAVQAQEVARLTKVNTELRKVCIESNAVCCCGCPPEEHENYGEDGEACGQGHECIRTSNGVASILNNERARRAIAELKLETEVEASRDYRSAAHDGFVGHQSALDALAAERAKVRELRAELRAVTDAEWAATARPFYRRILERMDALGLTGEAE